MIFFLRLISYTPFLGGVIVPAVQVVQARLGVVDVPAIAQGIRGAEGGGHGAIGGHGRTPGVVGVGHHLGAAGIDKTGDIALGIFQVEIPVAVVRHRRRASGVVGKVQLVAALGHLRQLIAQVREVVRRAVDCLGNALAIGIVAVGDAAAALAHRRQLAAVLPGVGPCAVGQGIAYGVVGDGLPIERRQQVRPIVVAAAAPGEVGPLRGQVSGGSDLCTYQQSLLTEYCHGVSISAM